MSIDFFVYSKHIHNVRRPELAAALRKRGWEILYLYAVRNAEDRTRVREMVTKRDSMAIEAMCVDQCVASCGITVVSPFDARSEYGNTLEKTFPREVVDDMLEARAGYNIRTSAGRSEISYRFQLAVWESLGELTRGLLEDPQAGRYLRVGPEGLEVVLDPCGTDESASDALASWIEAAKARGLVSRRIRNGTKNRSY